MPAIDANAGNFLFSTDYPLDKIIYMDTGSFTVGAMSAADDTVAHGLPFTPLLDGTWSTDPTFALSYDMGSGPASTASGFLFNIAPEVSANATNAIVSAQNNTGSPVTVYYRIFGFEPSNANLDAPFTTNAADHYALNTDYNYTKLYQAGIATSSTVISHGLGRRTQVNMWEEKSGTIRKVNENRNGSGGEFYTTVSTSAVTISFDPFGTPGTEAHYRIYLDN